MDAWRDASSVRRGSRHARGAVGDALDDEALDRRHLAPVRGVRFEHDLHAGRVADELVRPGTDGVPAKPFVADLRHVFLRHDEPRRGRRRPVEGHEIRPRLLELEADRERINDLDLPDPRVELGRPRSFVPVEAEFHVLGGHRLAVVKLQPAPQLELVREPIRALGPRLRQAIAHLLAGQRLHQPVVERVKNAEGRDLRWGRGRVEPRRSDGDVEREDRLSGRLRGRALYDDEGQRDGPDQHEGPSKDGT